MSKKKGRPEGGKNALSRQRIIDAGLALSKVGGAESVSFRKLAERLDVTPTALYRHFDDKEALLTQMFDQHLRSYAIVPSEEMDIESWLHFVAQRMYQSLVEEPSWIQLVGKLQLAAGGLEVMEACMQKLQQEGMEVEESVDTFFAILQCTFGAAVIYNQLQTGAGYDNIAGSIAEGGFDTVIGAADTLQALPSQHHISIGIGLLIDGLKYRGYLIK